MRRKFGKKLIVLMLAAIMTINTVPAMAITETNTKSNELICGGLSSMLTLDFSGLVNFTSLFCARKPLEKERSL